MIRILDSDFKPLIQYLMTEANSQQISKYAHPYVETRTPISDILISHFYFSSCAHQSSGPENGSEIPVLMK